MFMFLINFEIIFLLFSCTEYQALNLCIIKHKDIKKFVFMKKTIGVKSTTFRDNAIYETMFQLIVAITRSCPGSIPSLLQPQPWDHKSQGTD
jgi:hypothetical protein